MFSFDNLNHSNFKKGSFVLKKIALFLLPLMLLVSCGSTAVVKEEPPVEEEKEPEVTQPEPVVETPVVETPAVEVPVVEAPVVEEKPTVVELSYKDYVVKVGDTYYSISEKQYANRHLWPCIYYANINVYDDPDLIKPKSTVKIPVIKSIETDFIQIKEEMMKAYLTAYEKYLNKSSKNTSLNKSRAVGVLVSAELLYPGFIEENSSRINPNDTTEARKLLLKKYKK